MNNMYKSKWNLWTFLLPQNPCGQLRIQDRFSDLPISEFYCDNLYRFESECLNNFPKNKNYFISANWEEKHTHS